MQTIQNIEQSLDDIENAVRSQGESLRDIKATAATIRQVYEEETAHTMQRLGGLFLELLTEEIDRDDPETLGYKSVEYRAVGLSQVVATFIYRDVKIKVSLDWQRIGEFWLIGLDSEHVRRCDKGELLETLLQTFAQIRWNEKAAIGDRTID